jgi:SAM-dependent methyltransferase
MMGDVGGKRVLELGCGDGAFAIELWKRGADVVGIDSSISMIDAARARAAGSDADIVFCHGRAETLPFATGCFDLVVATTILCFLKDAVPTFEEIGRVLRHGGQLVIGELGKWSAWAAVRRIRGWLGSPLWSRARFRLPSELRTLAEQGGMVPGRVRGAIYYPKLGFAARLLAPFDPFFGGLTTIGAAFIALRAIKP